MKRPDNRQPIETLLILGAGASYAATTKRTENAASVTPLDKDFCSRIKNPLENDLQWAIEAQKKLSEGWLDEAPMEGFGLEKAIIRQSAHIDFLNAIQPRRKTGITSHGEYLNLMSHVVTYILSRASENHSKLYKRLYEQYFSSDFEKLRNRVITFNYDTIFDSYLLNKFSEKQVYFDKINYVKKNGDKRGERVEFPLLLKLHGSANWTVDTERFLEIVDPMKDGDSYVDGVCLKKKKAHMPKPDDEISPFIIPPIQNKPVTQIDLFKYLWTRASEYIEEAKNIVICGYSLPETDAMAQMLFRRMRNSKVENITIVDPDAAMIGKWMELFSKKT